MIKSIFKRKRVVFRMARILTFTELVLLDRKADPLAFQRPI